MKIIEKMCAQDSFQKNDNIIKLHNSKKSM